MRTAASAAMTAPAGGATLAGGALLLPGRALTGSEPITVPTICPAVPQALARRLGGLMSTSFMGGSPPCPVALEVRLPTPPRGYPLPVGFQAGLVEHDVRVLGRRSGGALRGPEAAERPRREEDDEPGGHGERRPRMERGAGDEPSYGLEHERDRVVVGGRVDPALEQFERHEHRCEEEDEEDGRLHDRAGLDRAEAHGDARRPEERRHVHEERERVHAHYVEPPTRDLHSRDERDDGDDRHGHDHAHRAHRDVAEQDPAPVARREHEPRGEAVLEVRGHRETGEHAAEGRRLEQHEAELKRRVARPEVEARHVADRREAAREPREEDEREDQRRQHERRVREVVVQAAPGDRAGDDDHVRLSLPRSATEASASPTTRKPAATAKEPRIGPISQPSIISARIPSSKYEIGLIDATVSNHPVWMRSRGRFADDRKSRTKKSGKMPCTASPDPVRSPTARPSAPKPVAASAPISTMPTPPGTPVAKVPPPMSPIAM